MMSHVFDDETLRDIFKRVIEDPNSQYNSKGYVVCPVCGEKILMVPTLRVMHEAIEKHVLKHKEELKANPIKEHQTAITIRLSLTKQVLHHTCRTQTSR
jgi:DNA-directed RNA polymerase subunit RPC12/RpoP